MLFSIHAVREKGAAGVTFQLPFVGGTSARTRFVCRVSFKSFVFRSRPVESMPNSVGQSFGPAEYPSQGSEALLHRPRSEGARARRVGRLWDPS